jgi:arylsulfatase A-like enzyme
MLRQMKARLVIVCVLGVALVVGTLAWETPAPPTASAAQPSRPNILLIVTDDQPRPSLGPMDDTRHWFFERGVRFTRAFATTPLCCPARASIFTGRYAHNHGVQGNAWPAGENMEQESTIQHYLREAGYRTGIAGKYLNQWPLSQDPPHFDKWWIFNPTGDGYYDNKWNLNGNVRLVHKYSTTFIKNRGKKFLNQGEEHDAKPWFLQLSPWAPHGPAVPEPKYAQSNVSKWHLNPSVLEEDRTDKPAFTHDPSVSLNTTRKFRRNQLRTLRSVDDLVEAIFKKLGELNERANTLAFFVSDNGFLWRDHGWFGKTVPYTRSIGIPMMARWPGVLPFGAVDDRLVTNVDIAPTIVDATGVPTNPAYPMDGRSLLEDWSRDRLLTEYWSIGAWHPVPTWASLRTLTSQYTEYYDDGGAVTFREYYDLVADPWQLDNYLADQDPSNDPGPEEQALLSAQLAQDRACFGTTGPSACP